jgi:hypothetical protein
MVATARVDVVSNSSQPNAGGNVRDTAKTIDSLNQQTGIAFATPVDKTKVGLGRLGSPGLSSNPTGTGGVPPAAVNQTDPNSGNADSKNNPLKKIFEMLSQGAGLLGFKLF